MGHTRFIDVSRLDVWSSDLTAIDENSGGGTVVYTAAATDPAEDTGPSNPVVYSFGGGTDDAQFSIDPSTGEVTLLARSEERRVGRERRKGWATDDAGNEERQ